MGAPFELFVLLLVVVVLLRGPGLFGLRFSEDLSASLAPPAALAALVA